ncbi:MAG: hypothetical protein AAF570_16485, partial [Bacteroidota bacterium]
DFMAGRFFTAPMTLGLVILLRIEWPRWLNVPILAAPVLLGLIGTNIPMLTGADYGQTPDSRIIYEHGIADERAYYYRYAGLLNMLGKTDPNMGWVRTGLKWKAAGPAVRLDNNMGFSGFYAGPEVHLVDQYALTDPLLARLPDVATEDWRIGHYRRVLPRGYLYGLRKGENLVQDPKLKQLNEKLRLVTRGPLFSGQRLRTIFEFFFQGPDLGLVDAEHFHLPVKKSIPLSLLTAIPDTTVLWNDPAHFKLHTDDGLRLYLDTPAFSSLQIQLRSQCAYTFVWLHEGKITSAHDIPAGDAKLQMRDINLSYPQNSPPPNALAVFPITHWCPCSIGKVTPLP